ncbi:MAG: YdcH family protein [Paracoccaceae bacterium]
MRVTEAKFCAAIELSEKRYRRTIMTVDAHIERLRERHDKISKAVEQAQRAPGASDFEIAEMKKEKLRLKEEIARLNA